MTPNNFLRKKYSVLVVCWVSFRSKLEHIKLLAKNFTAIIFNKLGMDTSSRLWTFFMCMWYSYIELNLTLFMEAFLSTAPVLSRVYFKHRVFNKLLKQNVLNTLKSSTVENYGRQAQCCCEKKDGMSKRSWTQFPCISGEKGFQRLAFTSLN